MWAILAFQCNVGRPLLRVILMISPDMAYMSLPPRLEDGEGCVVSQRVSMF